MQVLQAKLIWFLGCVSLLIVFYKNDFSHRSVGGQIPIKLRAGFMLIVAGTAIGILSRMGLMGRWLLNSGTSFYLENLFGYIFGWSLVVWGAFEGFNIYKERHLESHPKSRLRLFSEKATPFFTKEHSTNSLLDAISRYLLMALDSQAVALHRCEDNGSLNLVFQSGLSSNTEELLYHPQKESLIYAALRNRKLMASDTSLDLHSNATLEAKGGQLISGISLPISSGKDTYGVLTIFAYRQREYADDDIKILEMVSSALSAAMRTERLENDLSQETGFRELIIRISASFNKDIPLLSSLLESAKAAYAHLPFEELNLYVSGNAPVRIFDFAIAQCGVVNLIEGYFSGKDYPHLFKSEKNSAGGIYKDEDRKTKILRLDTGNNTCAWFEIKCDNLDNPFGADLISVWGNLIARKIALGEIESAQRKSAQWMSAICYYQEKALKSGNVAGLLQEMATMVTDLKIATYCQISLTDPQKDKLKTAAISQSKPLYWSDLRDEIPTWELEMHRGILIDRKQFAFDQTTIAKSIPSIEAEIALPDGIQHGIITPLIIGDDSVGLLTFGEFNASYRESINDLSQFFASYLAALISGVLSWHKEKRKSQEIKEGKKKLTIIQPDAKKEQQTVPTELTPTLKSRLNGPLAGIMASCEYLQGSNQELEGEIGHYINVIERNAAKIHQITSGIIIP